jgi:phage head maturation protease
MPNELEKKTANHYNIKTCGIGKASIKDVDLTKRTVTGVYNAYNFVDGGMDVLLEGCCKRSIKENGPESNAVAKIKHALFHDTTRLPGKILVLDERTIDTEFGKVTGVYFETKMDTSTEGNDTLIKYQEGIYDNHSIGFQYIKGEMIERDGQHGNSTTWKKYMEMLSNPEKAEERGYFYAWKEIKLFEGSTVAYGMNELTPFLGVKGKEDVTRLQVLSRIDRVSSALKVGTLSDDALQSLENQLLQLKQIFDDTYSLVDLKDMRENAIEKTEPSFYSKLANAISK